MSVAHSPNKMLQKRRMISYFVEAAESIIESEGLEGITLRKTANLAGYNSATLYNYFENLDHLLLFVGMKYVDIYHRDLVQNLGGIPSTLDGYINCWDYFFRHSFQHPNMFYQVFLSDLEKPAGAYIKEYYTIFPLELNHLDAQLSILLESSDLETRDAHFLAASVSTNEISDVAARELSMAILLIYEGVLSRVNRNIITPEKGYELCMQYLHQLNGFYTN